MQTIGFGEITIRVSRGDHASATLATGNPLAGCGDIMAIRMSNTSISRVNKMTSNWSGKRL